MGPSARFAATTRVAASAGMATPTAGLGPSSARMAAPAGARAPPSWQPPPPWAGVHPPRPTKSPEEREAAGRAVLMALGVSVLAGGILLAAILLFPDSASVASLAVAVAFLIGAAVVSLPAPKNIIGPCLATGAVVVGLPALAIARSESIFGDWTSAGISALIAGLAALVAIRTGRAWILLVASYLAGFMTVAVGSLPMIFVVPICALATFGRGWLSARAYVLFGLIGFALRMDLTTPVWAVGLVATGIVLLALTHLDPVTDKGTTDLSRDPRPVPGPRTGLVFGASMVGWTLLWFATWVHARDVEGLVELAPGIVALVMVASALLIPGGGERTHRWRDLQAVLAVVLFGFSAALEPLVPGVAPFVVIVVALALQLVPIVGERTWFTLRIVAVAAAVFACTGAVGHVWGLDPDLLTDPWMSAQTVGLGVLGIVVLMRPHPNETSGQESTRYILGLFLLAHVVVLAAGFVGQSVADVELGFRIGHALVSIAWLVFAALLVVRPPRGHTGSPLALGVAIAAAATIKLVMFDLSALDGWIRVLAFVVSGVLLIGVALLRPRTRPTAPAPPQEGPHAHHR